MTILAVDTRPASKPQLKLIGDLVTERPNWSDFLDGAIFETVFDVLSNVGNPDPKFIAMTEARLAIDALLKIKKGAVLAKIAVPATAEKVPTPFERLQVLLEVIPKSKSVRFALEIDGTWEFYSIDTRDKNGHKTRWVNKLLGAPGNWNRKFLPVTDQLRIARLIAANWQQAAEDYAEKHGRCARCDAHLSDERSRAAKVGWKCAQEWGWAW